MCEEHSPHSPLADPAEGGGPSRDGVMPIEMIRARRRRRRAPRLREIIPSTMGEPLLYEHFEEILALCRAYGIKLNLTTNGTFPRLGRAGVGRRIVPVTSDVKISWNGATQATHEAIMLGSSLGEGRSRTSARSSRCATRMPPRRATGVA